MTGTHALVQALKAELRRAGITYAVLARELGLAESSVKRLFARGDLSLARIDAVLAVLKMDFAELASRVVQAQPLRQELTLEQEQAVVADRKLLLMAICVLSHWTVEQIVAAYRLSEAEATAYLHVLDRLGVVDLRPALRYRLKVDRTFRWRPDGPVMRFFRAEVAPDYFAGAFDGDGEVLLLVHGHVGAAGAAAFAERLQRLSLDFAQQHLADQRLPEPRKRPYTLVVAMRSWVFSALRDLERGPAPEPR
jgi:hypothetical protein